MFAKIVSNVKTLNDVSDLCVKSRVMTEMNPAMAELEKNSA